jgi:glycosyltransferase involved in cell wall biosynthesis
MTDDLRRDLEILREQYARLEQQAEALRLDAATTVRDLLNVIESQRMALEEKGTATAAIAAIRASNTGRVVQATTRMRLVARRIRMAWRAAGVRSRHRRLSIPRAVSEQPIGVNVAGYVTAESGMGEATRCSIRALQRAGIPVALQNVRPETQRTADTSFTDFADANPHPFNLVHLNADNMEWFATTRGPQYFRNRYTIGYWFWELETFRPDWLPAFEYVDEVWVASEFSLRAIGKDAPVPVVHMPLGLQPPTIAPASRAHFGLPERAFVFLYVFDVSSQLERKNPMAAIRAFKLANLKHDEAVLLLKFTNGHRDRAAVRRLAEAAGGLNVVMLDTVMHRPELNALMSLTDCCVSLHRAEGFGLTIAEHMAFGKPAIATAYSGNLDFMRPDTSCLVPYTLVPITRDLGPYFRGNLWADPDVGAAGAFMRELAQAPDRARALGDRGRAYVARALDPDRSARLMRGRLEQVRAGQLRVSGEAPAPDDATFKFA